MPFSIVQYYGHQESRCGYCKGQKCSTSHGMHAFQLTPQDYQDLIDRGWRRSGQYCYKPHMSTTCCPCYTIKCDALEFKLSKSHKKILKRFNRFLRDGKKSGVDLVEDNKTTDIDNACTEPEVPSAPVQNVNIESVCSRNATFDQFDETTHKDPCIEKVENPETFVTETSIAAIDEGSSSSIIRKIEANPICKKAKQIRWERRQAKLAQKGICIDKQKEIVPVVKEKSLQDYLNDITPNDAHKLKIVLVHSNNLDITDDAYNLYRKYQLIIHNDKPDRLTLVLVQVNSKQFENSLGSTYELYQKYQAKIHNDPPKHVKEYLEFLQRSPLKALKSQDGPTQGYGSFHQQYWLDDKLIAVGVIDILPYCVSSVYFFYDPDYSFLTLGTYGSLREIAFVQELASKVPALRYYYMGFYVHSCPKMRYKGKLVPSYLLCPETYTWHLLNEVLLSKFDANKYQRLNTDLTAKDSDEFVNNHLDGVPLLVDTNRIIRYREYIQSFHIEKLDHMLDSIKSRIYKQITGDADDRESVLEYGKLVGRTCAERLIYLKME